MNKGQWRGFLVLVENSDRAFFPVMIQLPAPVLEKCLLPKVCTLLSLVMGDCFDIINNVQIVLYTDNKAIKPFPTFHTFQPGSSEPFLQWPTAVKLSLFATAPENHFHMVLPVQQLFATVLERHKIEQESLIAKKVAADLAAATAAATAAAATSVEPAEKSQQQQQEQPQQQSQVLGSTKKSTDEGAALDSAPSKEDDEFTLHFED